MLAYCDRKMAFAISVGLKLEFHEARIWNCTIKQLQNVKDHLVLPEWIIHKTFYGEGLPGLKSGE